MSSANIIGSNMFEALSKSFTYKKNKGGPKIEPCGIPRLIVPQLVFFFFIDLNELFLILEIALDPSMICVCYTI